MKVTHDNVGKKFKIKGINGMIEMTCTQWTSEFREFRNGEYMIFLDWMEYDDQAALGRITKA